MVMVPKATFPNIVFMYVLVKMENTGFKVLALHSVPGPYMEP